MQQTIRVITAILLISASLMAGPKYYVNTGISKPFAPEKFSGNWRTGFEIGGGLGFMLSEKIEVVPGIHYNNFSLNDANFLDTYIGNDDIYSSVSGGAAHIFDLGIDFKYLVPTQNNHKVTPYLICGAGYAGHVISKKDIVIETGSDIDAKQSTQTGWAAGGIGFEIVMGKNTYFVVEGRFNILFTDETTVFAPIKFGILIK